MTTVPSPPSPLSSSLSSPCSSSLPSPSFISSSSHFSSDPAPSFPTSLLPYHPDLSQPLLLFLLPLLLFLFLLLLLPLLLLLLFSCYLTHTLPLHNPLSFQSPLLHHLANLSPCLYFFFLNLVSFTL